MQDKIYKSFLIIIIFSLVLPFYTHATSDISYVWSEFSSPIITTSSILSEGER